MSTSSYSGEIAGELEAFLRRPPLRTVYLAEGKSAPPPLAFLVHFPRLSITLGGCDPMEIELGGKRQMIAPRRGEAVFVPPNCWNRPTWERSGKVLHLLFGKKHLGASLVEHRGGRQEPVECRKACAHRMIGGPLEKVVGALVEAGEEAPGLPVARPLVEALLHLTLRVLTETSPIAERKARATYERACHYVQENPGKPLTRDSVAAALRLSPNHLSRLFRQEGMMNFIEYLTWVRIDRAKFLLKREDYTVDAVARACGFRETAYFCRVFKSKTKLTPTEYRHKI